jgi:hypothetical protein
MIPDRPNFGNGPGGGSATEERMQDEWDAKYAPDLETARRTIDALLDERSDLQKDVVLLTAERNRARADIRALCDDLRRIAGPVIGA